MKMQVPYLLKKNPHLSGHAQFKPMLFQGQLYRMQMGMTKTRKTCINQQGDGEKGDGRSWE